MFADSSGWLPCGPCLCALRCLATGGFTLFFLSGACRLALVGLRCLWVPWSCWVQGLHDGVTCLRSGLCSSSARDRNEDLPSSWRVWFCTFALGSTFSGTSVFLRYVATLCVKCVFSSLLLAILGFLFVWWCSYVLHWFVGTSFGGLCSCLPCQSGVCQGPLFSWPHLPLRCESCVCNLDIRWLSTHLLLGSGVRCPLYFPSLSGWLWICRFLKVLFSHMVRILRDGVTPAGSRLVWSSIVMPVCLFPLSIMGRFFAMRSPFGSRLFSISFSIGTKPFLHISLGGSGPS